MTPSTMNSLNQSVIDVTRRGFTEHSPLPTFEAAFAAKVIHSSHKVTREHSSNGTACVENTRTLGQLVFPVPQADNVLHARIEGALCKTFETCKRCIPTVLERITVPMKNRSAYI